MLGSDKADGAIRRVMKTVAAVGMALALLAYDLVRGDPYGDSGPVQEFNPTEPSRRAEPSYSSPEEEYRARRSEVRDQMHEKAEDIRHGYRELEILYDKHDRLNEIIENEEWE